MKAYAYLRRSPSPDHEDEGSIDSSRTDVRKLATSLGAELPDDRVYIDDEVSGSKIRGEKTAWRKLLADIAAEPPDFLLAARYDRIGRRLGDLEALDDLAREHGFRVWTVRDGDLFASVHWPILAGIAKVEASNTRERVLRAQERRRAAGRASSGPAPYGYASGGMEVVPEEAETIREIVRRLLDGQGVLAVTRWLNSRGGRQWRPNTVSRMIRNPKIAGLLTHRGEVIGKAAWPGIITPEQHTAVLGVMSQANPGRRETSLLAGLARCQQPNCDARMASDKDRNGYRVYRCKTNLGGCSRLTRRMADVDAFVLERVFERLDDSALDRVWDEIDSEFHDLGQQSVDLDLEIHILRGKYGRSEVAAEDYYATLDVLRKRQKKVDAGLARTEERRAEAARRGQAQEHWESLDLDARRAVLRDYITAVQIYPHGRSGRAALEIRPGEIEILWRDRVAPPGPPPCRYCGKPVGYPKRYWENGPHWCDDCAEGRL